MQSHNISFLPRQQKRMELNLSSYLPHFFFIFPFLSFRLFSFSFDVCVCVCEVPEAVIRSNLSDSSVGSLRAILQGCERRNRNGRVFHKRCAMNWNVDLTLYFCSYANLNPLTVLRQLYFSYQIIRLHTIIKRKTKSFTFDFWYFHFK